MVSLLSVILFITFVCVFFLTIKIKKANWISAINFRQNYIAFVISIYLFALLPIHISIIAWIGMYWILREIVFRKDEIRKYQLYSKYGKRGGNPFPKISKMTQFRDAFFPIDDRKLRYKDFKYSFNSYSNTGLGLIMILVLKIAEVTETVNILYFIEIMMIASVIYLFLGRILYHLFLYAPNSTTYLCIYESYIPVTFFGLVYYFVVIAILYKVHGNNLFAI